MGELGRPLSASSLKTFEKCPERFRLKYLLQKPPEGGDTGNIFTRVGNAVHEPVENVLKRGLPLDDQQLLADRFKAEYRQGDWTFSDDEEMPGNGTSDPHRKVLTCLDGAAKYLAKRVDDGDIRGVELPVHFMLDAAGVEHHTRGHMDIATDSVVDWKTGKSEGKQLDEVLQGAVYMAGYYAWFGEPPAEIHYVYLDEGKVREIQPTDDVWQKLVAKARQLMTAVENDRFPGDTSGSNCYWCDYEVHCPDSEVGGGGIDWSTYP